MTARIHYILILFALTTVLPLCAHPAGKRFVVVIDAGHGGHDPGAIGKSAREKHINLRTALELGRLIEQNCRDVRVVYTRKTDVFVPLKQRAQIANNAKADLFISIHTNALPNGKISRGAETYTLGMARASENLEVAKKENSAILMEDDYKTTYKGFNPNSSESYIIFEFMQDKNMNQSVSFAKKVQQQFRRTGGRINKGVHQAGFLVLRETTMPSVLIELGYITTPDEEKFLNSKEGSNRMARCIYNAFVAYKSNQTGLSAQESTTKPVQEEELSPVDVADSVPEEEEKEQNLHSQSPPRTPPATASKPTDNPIFKIQILTADRKLSSSDKRLKGIKNVNYYRENGLYKYTYGESTNYNEILRMKKEISAKFSDCFIIAFRGEEKMNVNEAINLFKKRKR